MSNIDKQALREAAEKALPAMKRLLMMPNDELFDETPLNVDGDVDAANAFNLLTGPETVLALLDENDNLLREKDVMESAALAMRDDMRETREKLEAAERRNAELNQRNTALTAKLEPMDRRIAELENSETQLINERDNAEAALADMYQAATGERPEWSNFFGFADAVDAVEDRLATLESGQGQPVMFIDGDISQDDADKLAAVIREFNEETETPAARMARIIRENPHPTNMCDMPAAAGKGE